MKKEKALYLHWWFWVTVLLVIFLIIFVPIIINCLYLQGKALSVPNTAFYASDIILFFGSVLSFLGTVSLGVLALWQNKTANEINSRILKLEEISNVPFLHIDPSHSHTNCISEHELDIVIGVKNTSNGIIDIDDCSDMECDLSSISQDNNLPFCRGWTKHYSVLPDQVLEINFFKEGQKDETLIINQFDEINEDKFFQINCNFSFIVKFINSKEKYKQQYNLMILFYKKSKDKNFSMMINSIENSIIKLQEEK